jgi:hypothetical protein
VSPKSTNAAVLAVALAACAPAIEVQRVAYQSGAPHWEYELRDGVPDGHGRVWHPTGALASEGTYAAGIKHGHFRFYGTDGAFDHQALYWKDVEVWRSDDPRAAPSEALLAGLDAVTDTQSITARPSSPWSEPIPAPYFATLDRVATVDRVGLRLTTGVVQAMAAYADVVFGPYAIYGQVAETHLDLTPDMTLSGRRTAELGAARRFALPGVGTLHAHAGVMVPTQHDDVAGFVATTAGSRVLPGDAAAGFPSTSALRAGVSVVRQRELLVLQGDLGIDALLGGGATHGDALARANLGLGFGVRAAMLSLELTNTLRLSEPSRQLHAVAAAVTVWRAGLWFTAAYAYGLSGEGTLTMHAGYEL